MVSMTQKHELVLAGCTPEPLMSYLKALGAFRLVAEQVEAGVRACWSNDSFVLRTALDRDSLVGFFLEKYKPTPIISPWNGRCKTALTKGDKEGIDVIRASNDRRLSDYRDVIEQSRRWAERDDKELVLAECRNVLPDCAVPWLDAAYVLTTGKPGYPPLTSAGGTLGTSASGDLSVNFMQNVALALALTGPGRRSASVAPGEWLQAALFNDRSPRLTTNSIGQLNPGGVGGPNATTGFEAESLTNPWDFVLMVEGLLLFAGAAARRLSAESRGKAAFPFTVDTSAAGYGTAADTECRSKGLRGEMWMPLWDQPATYPEVAHLFAEGRAQLGGRQAATGTDFARAIVSLGVERGITSFRRFGFLQRSGRDGVIATPLGRFQVRANPKVDILLEIDRWLGRLRDLARGQNTPQALVRHLRQIDHSILELCRVRQGQSDQDTSRHLQRVLVALGQADAWLARSRTRGISPPLAGLRPKEWLEQANDGSPELRIAAAIASIQGAASIGPIRTNLEPVAHQRGRWGWADNNPSVVWKGVDLLQDMAAVMERRCLEARMKGLEAADALPLRGVMSAPLGEILAFLEGRPDERRIADLVLPLAALDWRWLPQGYRLLGPSEDQALLPLAYAVLKLLFLPWKLRRAPGAPEVALKPEPSLLPLLQAGRADEAYRVAWRRLYVSGLTPLAKEATAPPGLARRLAAALLIPIAYQDMFTLAEMALMPASESP